LPASWITQVVAGLGAGMMIYVVAKGQEGWTATGHMAANGFGDHSPGGYSLWAVIVAEVVLTGVFLLVILGSTDDRAPKAFAGLSIGLTLTLIHLISIPISNTSVNPARSTGVAFFNGDGAPAQLWVFWLAPLLGAAIAGIAYPYPFGRNEELADRPVRDDALEEPRYYLTGAFFLALLAAARSVLAPALANWPPAFSRCARTNHWNFSSSAACSSRMFSVTESSSPMR
jgi:aquaporin Z